MEYNEMTTEQLFRRYANCCTTAMQAGGHHKSEMNDGRAHYIAKELESRGEDVPERRIAAKFGTFNGEGSY